MVKEHSKGNGPKVGKKKTETAEKKNMSFSLDDEVSTRHRSGVSPLTSFRFALGLSHYCRSAGRHP
jgi:hypothetical protein